MNITILHRLYFSTNNQDNKSVRHLASQLFPCFAFFPSSRCFLLRVTTRHSSFFILRLRSVPPWTWRHVRWVDQSKTCQWRPRQESERHHCIKTNTSVMNWTRTTIYALCFIDSMKSHIYPSAWNDLEVIARFRHFTTYICFKNKEEKTFGPRIVTKGNVKCYFKTRSERNKLPHFRKKTKQTLQFFQIRRMKRQKNRIPAIRP